MSLRQFTESQLCRDFLRLTVIHQKKPALSHIVNCANAARRLGKSQNSENTPRA